MAYQWQMRLSVVILLFFSLGIPDLSLAQPDLILEPETYSMRLLEEDDPNPEMNGYEEFNPTMGGNKVRRSTGVFMPKAPW